MTAEPIVRIAVPSPLYRHFDYLPPADHQGTIEPGVRVSVPFGRTRVNGMVLALATATDVPRGRLRRADKVLDDTPLLSEDVFAMLRWAANYYHHPPGEVFAAALPVLLRQGAPARVTHDHWRLTAAGRAVGPQALSSAPRQAAVLERLHQSPEGIAATTLRELPGDVPAALRGLRQRGLVESAPVPAGVARGSGDEPGMPPTLTEAQQHAVDSIVQAVDRFQPFLLDGVTGSGKTEVYLRVIEQVLARGRQALVLVPEIGLTPQLAQRMARRFDVPMAMLHSGLTDRARLDAWVQAREGHARIVIGTRSAVFTSLPEPGVIVIDEEHDPSFKQQEGFRYSARDLAVWRARTLGIPVILGSATPALESLHNAREGRYQRLVLEHRTGTAVLPRTGLLDVRRVPLAEGLSPALLAAIDKHLQAGDQALLFLNRRGFAPTLRCHDCGWMAQCERCDARLTVHQGGRRGTRLLCHHCGAVRGVPADCPACNSTDLATLGHGTERVEQLLAERFPGIGIARVDRDTTSRRGSLQQLMDDIHSHRKRLLIGTQMLAKGHHFPGVTLVGIVDADHGLFGADFRAGERMAQLITQVAGRAGRAARPGEVLIQTHHPEHPMLTTLLRDGYHAFAHAHMEERRQAHWPPFSHLALVRAEATGADAPMTFLESVRELAASFNSPGVDLLGPVPASMERRQGRYRAQLLLQSAQRKTLHALLAHLVPALADDKRARKVRWSVDVDPQEVL